MTNDGANATTYDAENRAVTAAGTTYVYDGNNLRVRKCTPNCTSPTSRTVYIFSGTKVIAEYDNGAASTAPSREYIYTGGQLAAKIESGATTYFHADHLSARVVTDSTGTVTGQQGHYPYGESWYGGSVTKWKFTTYERDSESSNDYAMFRSYVNRLARFSSPDPLAGSISDPQSLNRLAYVANDPSNLVDPLGLTYLNEVADSGAGGSWYSMLFTLQVWHDAVYSGTWDDLSLDTPGYIETINFPVSTGGWAGGGGGGGGGQGRSGGKKKEKKKEKKKDECFAQLKYRPVDNFWAKTVGATHSFWYVQGSGGTQYIISGGPTNPSGSGYLNVWVSSDTKNGVDNVSATTWWNSGLSSANCEGVDKLLNAANGWRQNQNPYDAMSGPNSNSAANYLGGVGGFNPSAPPGALWGWSTPVPKTP